MSIACYSPRLAARWQALQRQGRSAFIPFIMAGDGGLAFTQTLLPTLVSAGADIIELGMPFSDPMADGVTIQEAGRRALDAGTTLDGILACVAQFRAEDDTTPLILMGYYNPIYHRGVKTFAQDAAAAGVDGIILVDVPPEEDEVAPILQQYSLDFIRLITPTTTHGRLQQIQARASGFLYYVAVAGVTGTKSASTDDIAKAVTLAKQYTRLPIGVGFGIRTPEAAAEVAKVADAVIVGSLLVDVLSKNRHKGDEVCRETLATTASAIAHAVHTKQG